MEKIIFSLIFFNLVGCSYFSHSSDENIVKNECKVAGEDSTQCKIKNLKDYTSIEKEASLGILYLFGDNKTQANYKLAYKFLRSAADNNNVEALNGLGIIYLYGMGKNQDYDVAEKYFKTALNLGDKIAEYNLGELYRQKDNIDLSAYWYQKAIVDNPYKAYEGLSKLYIQNNEYKKAFIYSEKAAELNNPEAEYNLGVFFEKGIYVEMDINKAIYWYQKAAQKGHHDAINNLQGINNGTVANSDK
jgi:uncharacterized protein